MFPVELKTPKRVLFSQSLVDHTISSCKIEKNPCSNSNGSLEDAVEARRGVFNGQSTDSRVARMIEQVFLFG